MYYLLAFVGMICWGIAPLFAKLGLKDVDPLMGLAVRTVFSLIIISSIMTINGSIFALKSISTKTLILLFIEAVLASSLGDLAYFAAIKKGDVSIVTIIMSSSPLVTILCATLFLGEPFTLPRVIGAVLIVIGIYIAV
jgi:transporter family protein